MSAGRPLPRRIFDALLQCYGPQGWWPADSAFEVMAGAVLVQRTAWRNAEAALRGLREAGIADWDALVATPPATLESLIRPSGFYRSKAQRLLALGRLVESAGGVEALAQLPSGRLRAQLLAVHGIGAETADAVLLYVFERPVFVVDAYARRLIGRLRQPAPLPADDALKLEVERALPAVAELNELHALIVAHGKDCCRPIPACPACCLRDGCGYACRQRECG